MGRRPADGSVPAAPPKEDVGKLKDVLTRMGKYETMDLNIKASRLHIDIMRQQGRQHYVDVLRWRWFVVLLVGASIGLFTFVFNFTIHFLWLGFYQTVESVIAKHGGFWMPYLAYMGFTMLFSLLATLPVALLGEEGLADGGGVSEIKAYLNGVHIRELLTFRAFAGRAVSGVFVNAGNLVGVGEAPLVHAAASLAGAVSRVRSSTLRPLLERLGGGPKRRVKRLGGMHDNQRDHRDFVAMGAGTGFTTAFVAPIGGMLFPAEEGGLAFSPQRLWMILLASCTSYIVLMTGTALFNQPSAFAKYKEYDMLQTSKYNIIGGYYCYAWELPVFAAMGALAGVVGAAFVALATRVKRARKARMPWSKPHLRVIEVLLLGVVTGTLWFGMNYIGPCRPVPPPDQQALEKVVKLPNSLLQLGSGVTPSYPQLWCPEGEYNIYGMLFWNPIQATLGKLVHLDGLGTLQHGPSYHFDNTVLFAFGGLMFFLICWTYGTAIAYGAFTPALTVGAAGGRLIGTLVDYLVRQHWDPALKVSLPVYSVIGAAALLAGFTRYKATAVVLVAEVTGSVQLLPMLVVAVAMANWTGGFFGSGIYDAFLEECAIPMLSDPSVNVDHAMVNDRVEAKDVMASNLKALPPVASVAQVLEVLKQGGHEDFPVSHDVNECSDDGSIELLGVISRKALLKMIQNRSILCNSNVTSDTVNVNSNDLEARLLPDHNAQVAEQQWNILWRVRPFDSAAYADEDSMLSGITEEEAASCYLDLQPFMQQSPLVVQEDVSMAKAYHMFQHLGVHELFVARSHPRVCGILTRKDVTLERGMLHLANAAE